MRTVRFVHEAAHEFADAAAWYEECRPGLGARFSSEVLATIRTIQEAPLQFPVRLLSLRRAPVRTFPYGVWYLLDGDFILIAAVYHGRRDPRQLRTRAAKR